MSSAYSVMGELASNAPDLILGRTLGFSAVAYYSRANGLQKMALFHVTTLVRGVYFPSFAQKIRNGHDAAQLYSRAMAYIVAVTAPALAMLALLAEPLILVLFGPQWERAAPLASILCAFSLLATPTSMAPSSLIATGQMALLARTQFAALCARIAALSSSLFLELEHTVMLVGLSTLLSALLYLRAMRIAFGLHLVEYWSEIRSAASLVPMTLALPSLLYSAEYLFQPGSHPGLLILGSAFGGATGWLFGIRLTNHPIKTELNGLVQRVRIR
jgi:O-antigen/teichoic acid export membrane protein